MWIALAIIAGLVLALCGVLVVLSPGEATPFLDANGRRLEGSLSEKVRVPINGVEQGLVIKSRDASNPVLLYLHGGMPDYFLTQDYPTGMDASFTVAWWDQRGSGLSFHPGIPKESMTIEQVVEDTIAVTEYLRARFGREKIYLMAHSGGTVMGLEAVARRPELYEAYVAVAQISHQIESERAAQTWMARRYRELGQEAKARELEADPIGEKAPLPESYSGLRDVAMHELGVGTMREMKSIVTGLFLRSLAFREYTVGEKLALWRGKIFSGSLLWNQELEVDLRREVPKLEVPAYFLHGVHDFTVSYPMAKAYFEQLEAPVKGFYSFQNSAHSPLFEEPARLAEILQGDVLQKRTALADPR